MKKYFVSLLVLVTVCFCSYTSAQDDNSELKQTLNAMNEKIAKAYMAHDNETMLAYYEDDAISLPSYAPMMVGKDAIKSGMEMEKNANYKITGFKLTNTNIITNGDLVCDIGTYEMTMEMENMDKPYVDNGKYLTVYKKQPDGSLKIKAEIWNSDINPWMKNTGED